MSANFVQMGRWQQCAHCGVILRADLYEQPYVRRDEPNYHWCGAPWQTKASDVPGEWVPGKSPLMSQPLASEGEPLTIGEVNAMRVWQQPGVLGKLGQLCDEWTQLRADLAAARSLLREAQQDTEAIRRALQVAVAQAEAICEHGGAEFAVHCANLTLSVARRAMLASKPSDSPSRAEHARSASSPTPATGEQTND